MDLGYSALCSGLKRCAFLVLQDENTDEGQILVSPQTASL